MPRTPHRRRRNSESGFVLLFVFLLAACAAISLYMELPKAAFESQRSKEQLLVERGMEYRRAIQLYVRKEKKYPPSIEALEKTNERRYLRRRYVDPMTGKDEWRVINIGPNGEFTNSVVFKPKNPAGEGSKYNNTFITEAPPLGDQSQNNAGAATLANRQRQSDQQGAPGQLPLPGQQGVGAPGAPVDPNQQQPYSQNQQQQQALYGQQNQGQPNPYQQSQFQPQYQQQYQQQPQANPYQQQQQQPYQQQQYQQGQPLSGYPQAMGTQPVGYPPVAGQQTPTGFQGMGPTGVANSQTGGVVPQQMGYNPYGQPQQQQPGVGQNPYQQNPYQQNPYPQNPYGQNQQPITSTNPQIAGQIMDMISRPRPNPNAPGQYMPGQQPGAQQPGMGNTSSFGSTSGISSNPGFASSSSSTSTGTGMSGNTFGGGIAGVASKYEAEGIMVINDRTKYNEWEFLYDFKTDNKMQGNQINTGQQQGNQNGITNNPGNSTFGGGSNNSTFGGSNNSTFGGSNNSGFGNQQSPMTTPRR